MNRKKIKEKRKLEVSVGRMKMNEGKGSIAQNKSELSNKVE